ELNKETHLSLSQHHFNDHADAVALGNEALKLVVKRRRFAVPVQADLLPGETEE
ncbi:unnamed protein product, partial [marine sediment metagenome]